MTKTMVVNMDAAYGAFLGLLCGDAAGAVLEFFQGIITPELVDQAMHMPGGGIHRVGPGQITDDSELALALARALDGLSPQDGFPLDAVAKNYRLWFDSDPYDMGNTCRMAFGVMAAKTKECFGQDMVEKAAEFTRGSQANGSLMRILPLALWAHSEPTEHLMNMAKQEATLSHPNEICQDCNAVYCLLVAYLVRHPHDHKGAIAHAKEYVQAHVKSKVRDWFLTESLDISSMVCTQMQGHVRWAFVLAIHCLRENVSYEQAIALTLLKGGDTDTNAAIVGGLIGALHGASSIPEYIKAPVLAFDCAAPKNGGQVRPAAYQSSQLEKLTRRLVEPNTDAHSS